MRLGNESTRHKIIAVNSICAYATVRYFHYIWISVGFDVTKRRAESKCQNGSQKHAHTLQMLRQQFTEQPSKLQPFGQQGDWRQRVHAIPSKTFHLQSLVFQAAAHTERPIV